MYKDKKYTYNNLCVSRSKNDKPYLDSAIGTTCV